MTKTISNNLDELLDGNKKIYWVSCSFNDESQIFCIIEEVNKLDLKLTSPGFITLNKLIIQKDMNPHKDKGGLSYLLSDYQWFDKFDKSELGRKSVETYKVVQFKLRASDIKYLSE